LTNLSSKLALQLVSCNLAAVSRFGQRKKTDTHTLLQVRTAEKSSWDGPGTVFSHQVAMNFCDP
jgi:hypothetical protein